MSDYAKVYNTSEKVVKVMLDVDRNDFAPQNPYADRPQYIGYNVTISAPHMHAFALEYLSDYCTKGAKILDVGSGSGFLTVALSKMTNDTGTVVGIDHITELLYSIFLSPHVIKTILFRRREQFHLIYLFHYFDYQLFLLIYLLHQKKF